ncbi:hypothetical protein [Flavobacterium sp. '19STA2R22 D10 B1']|uniref:hypothetical protein n=1 Tax=Flavobacterium aerium TaxID=3037261 RepID=UPI00278BCC14|nr:hypothetical protein [Flavobacterium sp. '19STA2R22 D10 B1']
MFQELEKYQHSNHFRFTKENELVEVCNAPENASGIYLVYSVVDDVKELIMVGSSGTIQNNGELKSRNGGLYDKIVNGHQFGKMGRKYSWPMQMEKENFDALEVYWYETVNEHNKEIPTYAEAFVLQQFFAANQRLPKWNVAF